MKKIVLLAALLLCFAVPSFAVELLIMAQNTYGEDAEADRFAWKIGHVVGVGEDGQDWGSNGGLPTFWKIRITGMTKAEAQEYLLPMANDQYGMEVGIRKWKLDTNKMTGAVRNKLTAEGILQVTRTQALNYMGLVP